MTTYDRPSVARQTLSAILDPFKRAGGWLINATALNRVKVVSYHGRPVAIKRRNLVGHCLTPVANLFFTVCDVPVHLLVNVEEWQWREIMCFRALNQDFDAVAPDRSCIREELLPGKSLWQHLKAGTLTRPMLRAAGKEFRRVHGLFSAEHNGPFSHGDAAMRNVLFDPMANRARFIDFELIHNADMPAIARQAEDLASFLFDLVSLAPRRKWLPWALFFLESYGDQTVIRELVNHLDAPRGIGKFWWRVRTNFADEKVILPQLVRLRQALAKIQSRQASAPVPRELAPANVVLPSIAMSAAREYPMRVPVPA